MNMRMMLMTMMMMMVMMMLLLLMMMMMMMGPAFCTTWAIEIHMDMSQEALCAEIYRENAGRFRYHLD